jgi:hypothetical protein
MPTLDPQTPIRDACDIDWADERAWTMASQWVITPQLVFACRDMILQEEHTLDILRAFNSPALRR